MKPIKVLLVDDSKFQAGAIRHVLFQVPNQDYEFDWAGNYNDALEKILKDEQDVCLVDYHLGHEGNGLHLVHESIKNNCTAPIIMVTGTESSEVDTKATSVGALGYLVKKHLHPIPLERTIRYAIERKRIELELKEAKARVSSQAEELEQSHKKLQEQHEELKNTQMKLVQSEKMAGLGTLVAGIAHEINNPVNFVFMSSRTFKEDLEQFQEFIFQIAEGAGDELLQEFKDKFQRFFTALENINEGSTRIKTIVSDLRTFSRLDEAEQKRAHVVDGLRSTIRLIETQYRKYVTFEYDFQVEQELECWPAQLNQVFMNLTANACQAIKAKQTQVGNKGQGILKLSTFIEDEYLGIRFQDTGVGMTPEVQEKIFEPFYTTKPVGEGTGMGLSISFSIIERHQGKIHVESTPGEGTTMTLCLPLHTH